MWGGDGRYWWWIFDRLQVREGRGRVLPTGGGPLTGYRYVRAGGGRYWWWFSDRLQVREGRGRALLVVDLCQATGT